MKASCFYISGMTEDERGGIFRCQWSGGAPRILSFTPLCRNTFLAWGKDGRTLYATARDRGCGAVAAFRVAADGGLTRLNILPAGGDSPCYLTVSADGERLYSANYASGSFSEFLLSPDGGLRKLNRVVAHHGRGIREEQRSPHPHCCVFTPDGGYLCVVDLGIDRMMLYEYDKLRGISPASACAVMLQAGSGPRHLCFDASGRNAYLLDELDCRLRHFRYADGVFTPGGLLRTVKPETPGGGAAAALRFSRNGQYLFTSTRGDDSIAVFSVDASGAPRREKTFPSCGASPRDFNFLPDCGILAVANEFAGETAFFACDQNTGTILELRSKLALPRPLYVLV
ncbi:MAG: lactonase family protein [Lentisphaeria bacterium]|nr:lactonase family protein [Lentisphaeria bacterium]